ncbi:MAG: ABC transporter permease, partial [Burkholderiaceae bacterium]
MKKQAVSQQAIVFAIFILMLLGFSVFLPGFLNGPNLLGLLQNVAILGILGLGMAVIVIGRGIDISMVAVLAVPSGLILQMVQDGHSVPAAFLAALALALVFGLLNGWLIAYAEVPSLFTTLASGLFLAGLGQVAFFRLDIVQWSASLDALSWVGRGTLLGVPMPVIMFGAVAVLLSLFLRRTRLGMYIYAIGDNPFGARTTGIPTRPVIVLQYVLAALIGAFAGMVMAASVNSMPTRIYNSTLIYDVILVVVLGG